MIQANKLLAEMNRIGVHFLVGEDQLVLTEPLSPAALLAGLAAQTDARLRLALIAVLLQHPEFAEQSHAALEMLDDKHHLNFKLYYTAAHFLQIAYKIQLRNILGQFNMLPDFYSEELKITKVGSVTDQLKRLAERHKEISEVSLNWYGTYKHAAQRIITRLELEQKWVKV